jgi:hypothetical protein
MKRVLIAIACAAILATLTSCQSLTDGAREQFSQTNTCPLASVEARERNDLLPSNFRLPGKPPADILANPIRLKMWQEQDEKSRTGWDRVMTVIELRGCGVQGFYECKRNNNNGGAAISCSAETNVPATITKW